jgi:TATA-box binding protein (TBP) (component of TFIID and TFIIIB)
MRKRTYTALVNDPVSIEDDSDVLYTSNMDHTSSGNIGHVSSGCTDNTIGVVVENSVACVGEQPTSRNVSQKVNTLPDKGLQNIPCNTSRVPPMDTAPLTTIHNLVGTCEIAASTVPIDLEYVYRCLPNSFYDRKRFAAITIRVTEPVCTGLLFTSGKLVITGCKTLVECVLASLKIVRMLERHIPTVTFMVRNAVVQNVVAHVVLPMLPGQKLNVDRLYADMACNCTFQKV